ncbi:unnamed protein product [Choristocarpus tenellus]
MAAGMEIDGPFVKVPCECLNQVFRKTRKTVTQEITAILRGVQDLGAEKRGDDETEGVRKNEGGVLSGQHTEEDQAAALTSAEAKLDELLDRLAKLRSLVSPFEKDLKRIY